MERYLIVNADDFGWTEGINEGIVSAHAKGIVTSTTMLAAGRAARHAVALAGATPSLAVGVHLAYQLGRPLIDPRTLDVIFRADGTPRYGTLGLWAAVTVSRAARRQLREHFRAQIDAVFGYGLTPSHLDTHKHVHYWPTVTRILCDLANEFSIPAMRLTAESPFRGASGSRVSRMQLAALGWTVPINRSYIRSSRVFFPVRLMGIVQTGQWTKQALLGILDALPDGWTELMVHPGHAAGLDGEPTRLVQSREHELDILTNDEVRNRCQLNKIVLANYRDLAGKS